MRTALLQITSTDDPETNLSMVSGRIDQAVADGAGFVLTPEVTNCLSASRTRQVEVLSDQDNDLMLAELRDKAAKHGIWALIGSLALKTNDPDGRFANRSFLIDPGGEIAAWYDKIHMFDVTVSAEETYRESAGYRPGKHASTAETPFGRIGLTICYDLRFPHLFRALAQAGCDIITVPSAFSPVTGAAHWEPLLRARAIETGSWILAPAQTGQHPASRGKQRQTYGHSLVVSPWGEVLGDGGREIETVWIDLDRQAVAQARKRIPSLTHDRPFDGP